MKNGKIFKKHNFIQYALFIFLTDSCLTRSCITGQEMPLLTEPSYNPLC